MSKDKRKDKMRDKLFKKWDNIVSEKTDSWLWEFTDMLRQDVNHDVSFAKFKSLQIFKIEHKGYIESAVEEYKKRFGDDYNKDTFCYDSFSLALMDDLNSKTSDFLAKNGDVEGEA